MKKALYTVAVIATVAIAGWNYQQNKEVELSDLAMANVEALASGESGVQCHIDPSYVYYCNIYDSYAPCPCGF